MGFVNELLSLGSSKTTSYCVEFALNSIETRLQVDALLHINMGRCIVYIHINGNSVTQRNIYI